MRLPKAALGAALILTVLDCQRPGWTPMAEIKPKHCPPAGARTYMGFHGKGPPSPELQAAVRDRFPDAVIVEEEDGKLGVVTAEPYSMESRARHEAAGAAAGWKGDTVDFVRVTDDCKLVFSEKFY